MAGRSLYQLLLEAMQDSRPSMLPDESAEIATRYPQSGVPDSARSEAQAPLPPAAGSPRDPNFRQLSRAPFAAQAQPSDGSNVRSNSPDYLWTASAQNAGSAGAKGDRPMLPWWAPPPPPMLPVPGGRFALPRAGGLGGPTPLPWPTSPPEIKMPEIPEAWKIFGPILMLHPELLRQRLLDEIGESKNADTAADPILELYQKRRRGGGSKAGPAKISNGPSIAPDAPGEVPDTADDSDFCEQELGGEIKRCWERFPHEYGECQDRAQVRFDLCNRNLRRMKEGRPPLPVPEKWGND